MSCVARNEARKKCSCVPITSLFERGTSGNTTEKILPVNGMKRGGVVATFHPKMRSRRLATIRTSLCYGISAFGAAVSREQAWSVVIECETNKSDSTGGM